jgi:hypothetical protein
MLKRWAGARMMSELIAFLPPLLISVMAEAEQASDLAA